jgi:hypothetical protein
MESDTVTVLSYRANATVGGKIAQVGSRLIDGVARKLADSFFEKFNQTVAPPPAEEASDDEVGDKPARRWGWFGKKNTPEQAE